MPAIHSGSRSDSRTVSPTVLRLLPHVPLPPARVLVVGPGEDAAALFARGYRVEVAAGAQGDGAGFDAVCEHGVFTSLGDTDRTAYVSFAARSLRQGGKLFGAFATGVGGASASELIHRFGTAFEVERLAESVPAPGGGAVLEAVFVKR